MTRRAVHLELSIDIGSDPITGSVTVEPGVTQQFSGWIELVGAIESAREAGADAGGENLGVLRAAGGLA